MKRIGEGYYYYVYELDSNRVIKKQTGLKSKLSKVIAWYGYNPILLLGKMLSVNKSCRAALMLSNDLAKIPELKNVLGNPVFKNDYTYEQDKAVTLEAALELENEEAFLIRIQEYVDANILLWKYGYGEIVYNFTLNAGISCITGKVILLDFNELTQSKERLAVDIKTRKWLTQASMRGLKSLHPSLHTKARSIFESAFTLDTLNKNWRKNSN